MHKSVEKNLEGLQLDVDCRLDWQLKYFLLQDSALKKKIEKVFLGSLFKSTKC